VEARAAGDDAFFMGGGRHGLAQTRVETAARLAEPAAEDATRDRLLVWRGRLGIAVARVDEAIQRFLGQVQGWGGHLAQRVDASVTCRVPAAKFAEAVAALRGYGRVTHESVEAQDVSKEHIDLGIRLDNARRARERLLALLEKATEVKDVLDIENVLRRLTEEIERMEGELKFLDDQVAMATLTAEFEAVAPASSGRRPAASRFPWVKLVGVEHVRRAF
jgi:hypothetical protein